MVEQLLPTVSMQNRKSNIRDHTRKRKRHAAKQDIEVGQLTYEGSLSRAPLSATGTGAERRQRRSSNVRSPEPTYRVRVIITTANPPHVTIPSQRARSEVENSVVNLPANKYMIQALMSSMVKAHYRRDIHRPRERRAGTHPKFWMWVQ